MEVAVNCNYSKCEMNFLNKNDIFKIVNNYIGEKPFQLERFAMNRASDKMLGFLAEYWKLKVEIKTKDGIKELHFFIKSIARGNEAKAAMVRTLKLFDKEAAFYTIIKPCIEIPDAEPWSAKLAAVLKNDLVLEDLVALGYKSRSKLDQFDLPHCKVALETLARFHSRTIIFEEIKRKTHKSYSVLEDFDQYLDKGGYTSFNPWYNQCITGALNTLKEFSKYGSTHEHFDIIELEWRNIWLSALELSNPSNTTRNVICHRDLWNNNLLFHYTRSGEPEGCALVDFQAVRYQPPAGDVMLLLYCNLDSKTRETKMSKLLQYYYSYLDHILSGFAISLEEILPMKEFEKSAEEHRKWGLVLASCLIPQIWMDDDKITEIFTDPIQFNEILTRDKASFMKRMVLKHPEYKEKVMELFDEIVVRFII